MGLKALEWGVGAAAAVMLIGACGPAVHDAAGSRPNVRASADLSPRQLCLTIFSKITGTKLPFSLHGQFDLMLKEATEIRDLAERAGSPAVARDLTTLGTAYSQDAKATYGNAGSIPAATAALQEATGSVVNALGCADLKKAPSDEPIVLQLVRHRAAAST
jgi:hypothetical protein